MMNPRVFLALILVCGALVGSASAIEYSRTQLPQANTTHFYGDQVVSYTHNANDYNDKITLIYFTVPSNGRIDFMLSYGYEQTVSGSISNQQDGWGWTTATVTLDGVTHDYTYWDTNQFYDIEVAGYAMQTNDTSIRGFLVSSDSYGILDNDLAVFYPVASLQQNLIYQVDASGPVPFNIEVVDSPTADAIEGIKSSPLATAQEWISFAFSIGGLIFGLVSSLFAWLKFLFVDNLVMIIALYLTITMAYAACTSRNVFQFFQRFFKSQKTFFSFLLSLWGVLVTIISEFRAIFRI